MDIHETCAIVVLAMVAGISACASTPPRAPKERSWSAVELAGMHLRLESPRKAGDTVDLRFARDGYLAVEVCHEGTGDVGRVCTDPATIWKIEDNRLKIGYAPSEGKALVGVSRDHLTMRSASGEVLVYAIIRD